MILEITRLTLNNGNIIKTFDSFRVNCDQIELDLCIIVKLKQMIAINNIHFKLIGSDNKCVYHIKRIEDKTVKEFCECANSYVESGIRKYNELVDRINVDIKRCNKKNSRPIKMGLLNDVKFADVLEESKGNRVVAIDDKNYNKDYPSVAIGDLIVR